ncbi:MAG: hypothetical protein QNJ44_19515 [Rhodobacter sp.]|nr:hypothetical protein [Rhodobacter sp.]
MIRLLVSLTALSAGPVFAHGAHAPVPDAAHGIAHAAGPAAALLLAALALGVGWRLTRRRD